jgi:putative membrane protein
MNSALLKIKDLNFYLCAKVAIAILIIIQISFYFYGIFSDFKLANEFRYIDEQTILDGNKIVSNDQYITENLCFDPNNINYKFNSYDNIFLSGKNGFSFHNNPKFLIFDPYYRHISADTFKKFGTHIENIGYNKDFNLTYDEAREAYSINSINRYGLDVFSHSYPMFGADTLSKLKEKTDFIAYNIFEQNMQILSRYYWEETPFMLNPINELDLDRDKSEIFSQYGFLSLYPINFIMEQLGGISVSNFEKTKNIVCMIYYVIAVGFVFLFFKNDLIRLIFIFLLSIKFFSISYYFYHYGPTNFDTRHFFDLTIVLLLFYASKFGNFNFMFKVICVLLALLSILMANDFGLYIFISLLGALIVEYGIIAVKNRKLVNAEKIFFILIYTILGTIIYIKYPFMKNPSIKYFLDGFYSFNIPSTLLLAVLSVIFIQWLLFIFFYKKLQDSKYLLSYLFLLFYTGFFYTYTVWRVDLSTVNFFIAALPFIIILNLFPDKAKKVISILCIFICIITYAKFSMSYIKEIFNYEKIFETHKIYKWNHERAGGIITTYPFDKFQSSINLINKYSPDTKEIYMISKYDNILQFFSKRYSGLKYFELRSFLVSDIEYNEVLNLIKNKADILYVDADIDRDYKAEIRERRFFDLYDEYWYNENVKQRIPKLEVLSKLFNEVREDYILVEKGNMIDVYRRK